MSDLLGQLQVARKSWQQNRIMRREFWVQESEFDRGMALSIAQKQLVDSRTRLLSNLPPFHPEK